MHYFIRMTFMVQAYQTQKYNYLHFTAITHSFIQQTFQGTKFIRIINKTMSVLFWFFSSVQCNKAQDKGCLYWKTIPDRQSKRMSFVHWRCSFVLLLRSFLSMLFDLIQIGTQRVLKLTVNVNILKTSSAILIEFFYRCCYSLSI